HCRKLSILVKHDGVTAKSEENSSQRYADEVSVAQEDRLRSEKSTEEEEGERNNSSKSNEYGEGENEQRTHTAESSSRSPSSDTKLVKPIRYYDYNFETSIDRHPNLTSDIIFRSGDDATTINCDGVGIGEFSLNFGVDGGGGGYSPNVGGVDSGGGGEGFSPIYEEV
ncbi:hypothetical protein HAX54_046582, partial [Datura stramonium]|nr:hypothetical protein [Datura stramonium]